MSETMMFALGCLVGLPAGAIAMALIVRRHWPVRGPDGRFKRRSF